MRVIAYEDVVDAARRRFLATSSIEVEPLADDLAVSRATLYRVMRTQDRLLGDVLWQLTERALLQAVAETRQLRGIGRFLAISERFEADVASFEPLQRWVRDEPLQASRVLFTPAGGVHARVVRAFARLFARAQAAGEIRLPCAADEFAYLYVRVGETLLHGELLAGVTPDPRAAARLRRAMLEVAGSGDSEDTRLAN